MLTLSGTVLISKVTYELKTRWKACFPVFDSNRKRHSSQGRERVELQYHRPLRLSGSYSMCPVEKESKIQSDKQDIRPNITAWALAVACLTSSRASVYDSVLLHLPAIQMLMVLAAEQWKKIPGVVTGRASIWNIEPSPGSSFQQDRRLLGGSHAVCAYSGLYRTWQIQITSLFYANNIQHGKKKVASNSQGQWHYSLHESVW